MTDNKDIQLELDQFTDQFKSLMIASLTKDLMPYTSYAPFIKYEQSYYFIISKIAKHYENLMHHSKASIMFIEDESNASHIFFRKRLSYLIDTSIIESNRNVKQTFIDVFGHFINQLFSMDFVIVKCNVIEGNIILGPGKAFQIDQNEKIIAQMKTKNGHRNT